MSLLDSIAVVVEAIVGRRLRHSGRYSALVCGQASDGTLELLPDDPMVRGGGYQRIPQRYGLPGFVARVPAGTRTQLGFANADTRYPYATAWEPGAVTDVTFDGGSKAVARVDDVIDAGGLYWDSAGMMPYWRPPTIPFVWIPVASGVGPPTPATVGTPLLGLITTGNPKLLA